MNASTQRIHPSFHRTTPPPFQLWASSFQFSIYNGASICYRHLGEGRRRGIEEMALAGNSQTILIKGSYIIQWKTFLIPAFSSALSIPSFTSYLIPQPSFFLKHSLYSSHSLSLFLILYKTFLKVIPYENQSLFTLIS